MLGGTGIWSRAQALVVIAVAAYLIPETDDARAAIPARHVEAGLFLHGGSPVTAPCDDAVRTAPGTAAAVDPGGLHAVLLLDGPDAATADTSLAFFEVRSASSGGTIHVYNFTHQGGEYRLHVPPDALAGISDMADPAADEYGVRAVSWPVTIYDGGIYQAKYIGNENVGMDDYATFGSNTGWAVLGQAVVRGGGGSAEARPSATAGEPGSACVMFGTATINDDVDPVAIPNSPYNIYRVERGETFEDPGATCYDDTSSPYQISGEPYAHVSTSDIVDARGVQGIDYACVDLAGNPSRTVRTDVLVDDLGEDGTEPVVTVVGDAAADVPNGEGYYEEGAVCRDGIEGYLPISRTIYALRMHPFEEGRPNAIDAGLAATWKATYECSDSSGNVGVNTLPVPSVNSRIVRTNGDVGDFLTGPDPVRIRSGGELPRPLSIQCSHSNEVDPDPWTMDLETPGTRTYDYECIISKVVIPRTFIITEEEPDISDGHPVVRLLGDVRISHGDGIPYVERGAVCGDPEDGALPVTIIYPDGVADGSTLPGTASEFHVGYVCEDAAGNQAFTSRTAVLDDRRGPEIIPNLANNTVHQWAAQLDPAPDAECVDPSGIKSKRVVHSIDVDAVGGYEIRFECTDSFDNTSELEYRFLVADMVPPTARFSSPHPHPHNSAYVPPEAICDDNYDGEGYARAAAEGPVDHRVPGDYNVTYTCTDSHGNRLVANGTVSVVPDDGPPVITIHGEPEMGPDRAVVPGPWATCTDYPPGGPPEGIAIPMHDPPLKALPARSFVVEMSYGIPDGGMVAVNATLTCRDDSGNVATRVASGTIPPDVTTQDPATPTESGPDPPAVPGPSNPTNKTSPDPTAAPDPSPPTNKTNPDPVTTPKTPTSKPDPTPVPGPSTPTNKTNPDPVTTPKTPTSKPDPTPVPGPSTPTNKTNPDPVTTPMTPTNKTSPDPTTTPKTPTNKPDPPAVPGPSTPTNKTNPDPVTTPKTPTNKTSPDPVTTPKTPTNKTSPDPVTTPKTPTNKTSPDPTTTPKIPTNKTSPDPTTTPKTPTNKTSPDPTAVPGPSTPTNKTSPDPATPTKTPTGNPDPMTVPGPDATTPTTTAAPDPAAPDPTVTITPGGTTTTSPASARPVITLNEYVRPDTMERMGNGTVSLEQGELYWEPGAACRYEGGVPAGAANATVGGQRVMTTIPGTYVVAYACSLGGADAEPAHRTVIISGEDGGERAENRPVFMRDGRPVFGSVQITRDPGSIFDEGSITCVSRDGSPIMPLITAAAFGESIPARIPDAERGDGVPDIAVSNMGMAMEDGATMRVLDTTIRHGLPREADVDLDGGPAAAEFVGMSPPARYVVMYDCEDPGSAGLASRVSAVIMPEHESRGDDWNMHPTFGTDWETNERLVTGGFSLNGERLDIHDNFHLDFEGAVLRIGQNNTVSVKVHSPMHLETVSLWLGVPEISRVTDAEAGIEVDLVPDYASPIRYEVTGVRHVQGEELVDEGATSVSAAGERCNTLYELLCLRLTISFAVNAPLVSGVMAISAMDTDRRLTTTYVNEGVEFEGEALLPARTAEFVIKRGNQHPAETVRLVQEDRRYNVWTDQDGFAWMVNGYGSWLQLTRAAFERLADPAMNVMTRSHGLFGEMVDHERERALGVFDSGDITNGPGGSFSLDAPVRTERLDGAMLELLQSEEARALEYLQRISGGP